MQCMIKHLGEIHLYIFEIVLKKPSSTLQIKNPLLQELPKFKNS